MGCDINWTVLLVGLCVGFVIGFLACSLLAVAHQSDRRYRMPGEDR
jgi:uncharacterized membrane-anchored protein YhcB (DUF1043 family)